MISNKKLFVRSFTWTGVRQSAEVSNLMTSVERVLEYRDLEPEKQPEKPQEISANWPIEGSIEFRNVIYKYFEFGEPVLRNLSFVIAPKEKIGEKHFSSFYFQNVNESKWH